MIRWTTQIQAEYEHICSHSGRLFRAPAADSILSEPGLGVANPTFGLQTQTVDDANIDAQLTKVYHHARESENTHGPLCCIYNPSVGNAAKVIDGEISPNTIGMLAPSVENPITAVTGVPFVLNASLDNIGN